MHSLYVAESQNGSNARGNKRLQRVVSLHPGFVQTGLGKETWGDKAASVDDISKAKSNWGAISIEAGTDTLLYTVLAKNGAIDSGKHYYLRKVVPF